MMLCCCTQKVDPVAQALEEYVMESIPDGGDFKLTNLEMIGSTTLGEELDNRLKLFELKIKQNTSYLQQYTAKGMKKNMEKKQNALLDDKRIYKQLVGLRDSLSSKLDSPAYYDYKFSATVKGADAITKFDDAYLCITPDFKVLGVTLNQKDLHKGAGRSIPGYKEILKDKVEFEENPERESIQ